MGDHWPPIIPGSRSAVTARPSAIRDMTTLLALLVSGAVLTGCGQAGKGHGGAGAVRRPGSTVSFESVREGPHVSHVASSPSATWADVDGDGDDDLFVLNGYASLKEKPTPQADRLYLNDGEGGFTATGDHDLQREPGFSGSTAWGDYDNDGDPDVFIATQKDADNRLFRNEGGGTFKRVVEGDVVSDGGRSFSATWVDMDNDGLPDLHVLNGRDGEKGQVDFVYRNLGGGRFERLRNLPFTREPLRSGGAAWGDMDGDGDPDLFLPVYSAAESSRLYRNDGNWRFVEVTERAGLDDHPLPFFPPTSVASWVDLDNDLDLDLFVGNTRGFIDFVFKNDGNGRFRRTEAGRVGLDATYVSDAAWLDLDNDADRDLVIAAWGGAPEIYLNDGKGRLRPSPAGDLGAELHFISSIAANDADADGDLDLYLTQWPINERGGAPNLYYENTSEAGNWLAVEVRGTRSNSSAIGARIVVAATTPEGAVTQLRQVSPGTSWRSEGTLVQHFGLGTAEVVDWVEVRWPSGTVRRIQGPIASNRRLTVIEEGAGPKREREPRDG